MSQDSDQLEQQATWYQQTDVVHEEGARPMTPRQAAGTPENVYALVPLAVLSAQSVSVHRVKLS